MSWSDYEKKLKEKNPSLRDPELRMTLTTDSFLNQLWKAFMAGQRSEHAARQAAENFEQAKKPESDSNPFAGTPFGDLRHFLDS